MSKKKSFFLSFFFGHLIWIDWLKNPFFPSSDWLFANYHEEEEKEGDLKRSSFSILLPSCSSFPNDQTEKGIEYVRREEEERVKGGNE